MRRKKWLSAGLLLFCLASILYFWGVDMLRWGAGLIYRDIPQFRYPEGAYYCQELDATLAFSDRAATITIGAETLSLNLELDALTSDADQARFEAVYQWNQANDIVLLRVGETTLPLERNLAYTFTRIEEGG